MNLMVAKTEMVQLCLYATPCRRQLCSTVLLGLASRVPNLPLL